MYIEISSFHQCFQKIKQKIQSPIKVLGRFPNSTIADVDLKNNYRLEVENKKIAWEKLAMEKNVDLRNAEKSLARSKYEPTDDDVTLHIKQNENVYF